LYKITDLLRNAILFKTCRDITLIGRTT